ncbi:hypothetical protein BH20CHL6_BH20CHL6_08870 [soil metagenome]
MSETERRFLGMVEVDSGTLLIVDPRYVPPRAATEGPGRTRGDADRVKTAVGQPRRWLKMTIPQPRKRAPCR